MFGVPDDDLGEEVKAVVQPVDWSDAGPELEAELIEYCRARIAHYKCPRTVDFERELPRLDTGKLYKRQAARPLLAGAVVAQALLRVATFNIRHGARVGERVDHRALVQTCRDLDADVVGLQEVDNRRRRSSFRNQATLVARSLGYTSIYGPVVRTGPLGRYGNALLARSDP